MLIRRLAAVLVLLGVVLAGCGDPASEPEGAEGGLGASEDAVGGWEALPEAPLSPRGGAAVVWTGGEVVLVGGGVVHGEPPLCPPDKHCDDLMLETEPFTDGAAYDPAGGTWRPIASPPQEIPLPWPLRATRDGLIGAGSRLDAASGTWSPLPTGDALVYDPPQWTGEELVALGWDYTLGEQGGVGQVVVSELDPDRDIAWRSTPWPFDPPGLESISSVWTGEEVIVFVWRTCQDGTSCTAMLGWDPAVDTWRDIAGLPGNPPRSPGWDGTAIIAGTGGGGLQRIDPVNGEVTPLPVPPADLSAFDPLVRPGAAAIFEGDRGAVLDLVTMEWMLLPEMPFEAPGDGRATVWAGEDLLVWGGARNPSVEGSRDTAEGYLLRLNDPDPATVSTGLMDTEPGWSRVAASPLTPRHSAAAFEVAGEVLILGGRATPVCPPGASCVAPEEPALADGAAYDPSMGRWRTLADAPAPLISAHGVVLGDRIHLLLADDGGGTPPRFLAYDVSEDRWDVLPPPRSPWLRLVVLGDRIAGVQTTHELGAGADLLYDPVARSWTELPPDPTAPSFDRAGVEIDGELIVLGLPHVAQPAVEPSLYHAAAYQPTTRTWRLIADPSPDRAVAFWDSSWFAIGGQAMNPHIGTADGGETNPYDRLYPLGGMLDPSTGTWSHLPDPPPVSPAAGPHGNWVLGAAEAVVADGWMYGVSSGAWTQIAPNAALPDEGHATVLLGERLFVWGGGRWDGTLSADGWLWTPPPR